MRIERLGLRTIVTLVATLLLPTCLWAVGPLKTVPVGNNPGPVVVNPIAHLVYVVNRGDNTVSILDSQLLTVKNVLKIGAGATAIAANPAANLVYVANTGAGSITGISGTKLVGTVNIGGSPVALVVDAPQNQLYIADAARKQVLIYNATSGALLTKLPTGLPPAAMAVNLATHNVFVACNGSSDSVVVIDGTQNQIVKTVAGLPAGSTSISVDPVSNVATLASPTANMYTVINVANGYSVLEEPADPGADPLVTAYDPGGLGAFFLADTGDGNIFFSDGSGVISLGNAYQTHISGAGALVLSPTTNQMALAYPAGDFVYIIDLLNPLFTSNYHFVQVGLHPTGIAFDPLTNRVFVTNAADNTVSVVDITPGTAVPAYEENFGNGDTAYDHIDANPATGTIYTLQLGTVFAINEAQAGAGDNGTGQNSAGVTAIPLAQTHSESVVVNPATNKIYAGDNQGFFYSIDGGTNKATQLNVLPASAQITALAVDTAVNKILAYDLTSGNLFVLDSTTDTLLKTVPIGSSTSNAVFIDPATSLAYVVINAFVKVVDPNAGAVVATIPFSGQFAYGAFNAPAHRLYVGAGGFNLYVIDTSQNTIATTVALPRFTLLAVGVNPLTGNYYVGMNDGNAVYHIQVYSGASNSLITDLISTDHPEITDVEAIVANPLNNSMYVGSDRGNAQVAVAVIDGLTNAVTGLPSSPFETITHALTVELGDGLMAAAGISYTTLYFPTSDVTGGNILPIAMSFQGVKDAQTIATNPLFRTRNTTPSMFIAATSNFSGQTSALVPKQAFYQVDGWQGTWTAVKLTPQNNTTSFAKVKLAKLATGQHILYAYASVGDVATVQSQASGENSPVISPIGSFVFTVEQ